MVTEKKHIKIFEYETNKTLEKKLGLTRQAIDRRIRILEAQGHIITRTWIRGYLTYSRKDSDLIIGLYPDTVSRLKKQQGSSPKKKG